MYRQTMRHLALALCGWASAMGHTAMAAGQEPIEVKCNGQCNLQDQLPLAVLPFEGDAQPGDFAAVVSADLSRSAAFAVSRTAAAGLAQLTGKVSKLPDGRINVWFELRPDAAGAPLLTKSFVSSKEQWRAAAHTVSDWVYNKLTGGGAMFNSRIAFVERSGQGSDRRYRLVVTDADGARAVAVLTSPRPITSPTWSPDGQLIAYTSFENTATKPLHKARVWVLQPSTGQRRVVADLAGDNAFASWSPDGQQLAVALSFSGATKVYTMQADGSSTPRRLTTSVGSVIETEPFWSAQGDIYFASDLSGAFQIYRYRPKGNQPATSLVLTAPGEVSTPSVSPDGSQLAFVLRSTGAIGLKDLSTGEVSTIPHTQGMERPSWAPNGHLLLVSGGIQPSGNSKPLRVLNPNVKGENAHQLGGLEAGLSTGPTQGDGPSWGKAFTNLSN